MELKTGYKQTEVGVIPSDWEVKKLGELGKFSKGSGVRKDESLSGDIPCVRYGELYTRHSNYIKQFYSYISKEVSETAKKLKTGDILFAGSGETKEEIGKSVAFIDEFDAYAGGDIVILTPTNVEPLYLGYLLNAPIIQKQKASRGQGDAVVHISAAQLAIISIALPANKAEQTAIATTLSDTDQYITHLEKLIAKKRNIKQGAMQELLRAKEGWVVKKLGEVAEIIGGGTPSTFISKYWNGTINWFTPTEIGTKKYTSESIRKITKEGLSSCSATILPVGAILLTTRAGIGDAAILTGEGCTNQGFQSLVAKQGYNHEYIYYLVLTLKNTLLENASGSTFLEISPKKIKQIEILIPAYDVQAQIATILSDMDSEIATLETKLSKAQSIKQGMMQQLLTGKIRLI